MGVLDDLGNALDALPVAWRRDEEGGFIEWERVDVGTMRAYESRTLDGSVELRAHLTPAQAVSFAMGEDEAADDYELEDGRIVAFTMGGVRYVRDDKDSDTDDVYAHLAHALARDYTELFYVNLDTDEFIEFHTDHERGVLVERRRAAGFFENCRREARLSVHPEDQDAFARAMSRESLTEALSHGRVFQMTYRKVADGRTFYVQLNASRMGNDAHIAILSVSDIDELVMKRRAEERIREERIVYARLQALTGNFIAVYVVDPATDRYHEFSATDDIVRTFTLAKEGERFFETSREASRHHVHPADLSRFLTVFTKANVMAKIEHGGIFTLGYRLLLDDGPIHVQMKAAIVEEDEGPRLVVGLNDVDAQVRQEEEVERRLAQAQSQASVDALTGVKNRYAYLNVESRMDSQIVQHCIAPFAIVMLDINDLKMVNDTAGHQAGDRYLRNACKAICETFKHSPVFRVGGDEFVVIAQGRDYASLDERLSDMNERNAEALRSGGVVIAYGVGKYDGDSCVSTVFERADQSMYENKCRQKAMSCGQD